MGCNEQVHRSYWGSMSFKGFANFSILLGGHVVVGEGFEGGEELGQGNFVLIGPRTLCCSIFKFAQCDRRNSNIGNTSVFQSPEYLFGLLFDDVDTNVGVEHESDHKTSLD